MAVTINFGNNSVNFDTMPDEATLQKVAAQFSTPKEPTTFGEDIKIGLAQAGKTLSTGGAMLGSLVTPESGDDYLFGSMEAAHKGLDKWANPENKEQSFGGKAVSMIGTLPAQLAALPFSPAQTGKEAIDLGESTQSARQAALWDTAGNVVGVGVPAAKGLSLAGKVTTGAGIGAAQDVATRMAISESMQTEQGQEHFKPTLETTALAGMLGGGIGTAVHLGTKAPKEAGILSRELTEPEIKERVVQQQTREMKALDMDILEQHKRSYHNEQTVYKLTKENNELDRQLDTAPPEKQQEIADKIVENEQRIEKANKSILEADEIISVNENIVKELADTLGVEYKPQESRIKDYYNESILAGKDSVTGNIDAINRARIAKFRSEGQAITREEQQRTKELTQKEKDLTAEIKDLTDRKELAREAEAVAKQTQTPLPEGHILSKDLDAQLGAKIKERNDVNSKIKQTGAAVKVENLRRKLEESLTQENSKKVWSSLDEPTKNKVAAGFEIIGNTVAKAFRKLIRNDSFTPQLKGLHEEYVKWKDPKATDLSATRNKVEFYNDFYDFYVQKLSRDFDNPPDTPHGKFIQEFKKQWSYEVKRNKTGVATTALGKDLFMKTLADNREAIIRFAQDMWTVRNVEETRISPSIGKAYTMMDRVRSIFQSADEVMAEQLKRADINPASADLSTLDVLGNNLTPLLQKVGLLNNPVVTYAVSTIQQAIEKTNQRRHILLGGIGQDIRRRGLLTSAKRIADEDSYSELAHKASNKDFYTVHEVLLKGENRYDYDTTLAMYGTHLTETQRGIYKAVTKVYAKAWEMMNAHQQSLGKKTAIPIKLGYIAPVRKGEFTVQISMGPNYARGFSDKLDATRSMDLSATTYVQRFFSKAEANNFIREANKNGITARLVKDVAKIENPYQVDIIQTLRDEAREAGASPDVLDRMDAVLNDMVERGGTIGSHHKKQMAFIEGYQGRELFKTNDKQGESFRQSIFDYVDEITKQMEKQEISTRLDTVLLHPEMEKFPNLQEYIQDMRDHSLNTLPKGFLDAEPLKVLLDEMTTAIVHRIDPNWYPDKHVWDSTIGKVTHAFYISVLMSRPAFWIAQSSAFTITLRSLAYENGAFLSNFKDMSFGFRRLMNNDKEFFDYVDWVVKNRSTFHPQFINDLNKFSLFEKASERTQKLIGYVTGETQSTAADSFSRLLSSAMLFEHYTKKGYKGQELYDLVALKTDENMVQYGQQYKAPMFRKMGVVGELMSPLMTFNQAQLTNLAADIVHFKRNKDYKSAMPIMMTFSQTLIMGGAMGMALSAELELLAKIINSFLDDEDKLTTPWEYFLGSPTGVKELDRAISHGILSASTYAVSEEGYDIGSSNRWRPVVAELVQGDKNWSTLLPIIPWVQGVSGAFKTNLFDEQATPGERRENLRKAVPGMYFGAVDALKYDSFGEGPILHSKNDPQFMKTTDRAIAPLLGTQTIDVQTAKTKLRIDEKLELKLQGEIKKIINHISLNEVSSDEMSQLIEKLAVKYKQEPDQIFNKIQQTIMKASTATEEFGGVGKSMAVDALTQDVKNRYYGEQQ